MQVPACFVVVFRCKNEILALRLNFGPTNFSSKISWVRKKVMSRSFWFKFKRNMVRKNVLKKIKNEVKKNVGYKKILFKKIWLKKI